MKAILAASAFALAALVSPQVGGTVSIAGTVVDAAGTGLPGVDIRATDESSSVRLTARSRADGRFSFSGVPAGRFVVEASAEGYLPARYGAFAPDEPGVPVRVETGTQARDVRITLERPAAISGRAIDSAGRPVPSAVHAMAASWAGAKQTLRRVATARTDAEGRYEISGLMPGGYLVLAAPFADRPAARGADEPAETVPVPTFYPSAAAAGYAATVTVAVADTATGIDVIVTEALVTTLSATLTRNGRDPAGYLALLAWPEDSGEAGLQVDTSPTARPLGLARMQAGRYVVVASALEAPSGDAIERLWATHTIDVDARAPVEIAIALGPGALMEGRLVFEGATGQVGELPETWLWPLDGDRPDGILPFGGTVITRPSGEFTVSGIAPGRYVLHVRRDGSSQVAGWSIKRVVVGGQDVADLPMDLRAGDRLSDVEIVMSNRASELAGTLTDTDGRVRFDVTLVAFSADSRYWWTGTRRMRLARPDTSGFYLVRGLPAGEYLLAAVTGPLPGEPSDPQWLAGLTAGAVTVLVTDEGRTVQDLRVGR